jgi:hypothetical protein
VQARNLAAVGRRTPGEGQSEQPRYCTQLGRRTPEAGGPSASDVGKKPILRSDESRGDAGPRRIRLPIKPVDRRARKTHTKAQERILFEQGEMFHQLANRISATGGRRDGRVR